MNVLITGASSGIGAAIALESAQRGSTLFLGGRNRERLEAIAAACRDRGAEVYTNLVDVTDEEAMRAWIEESNRRRPIDRLFANAGVSTGEETEPNVRNTFAVNVNGCLNAVLPALALPKPPHLVITASIAGYGPLKACPSYSATKACVKTWALALRGMLAPRGIRVSAVCPGFVRSRITDGNTCPMPFFMEADQAARIILKGVDRNVGLISFPWPMRFGAWLLASLPYRLNEWFNRLLPKKVI